MRYIELNPVRAQGMAEHPADYPWSSYHCNALGKDSPVITTRREYQRLGATDQDRQAAYRQLFRARIPETTLAAIREATNKAWALGDHRFKAKVAKQINRPLQSSGHGGDRKSKGFYRNQRV